MDERERVVLHRARQPPALGLRVREAQRDLEHEQHEDRDRQVAEEETPAHVTTLSSAVRTSRNPTPRTVSIHAGSPSFLRSAGDVDVERLGRPVPVRVPDLFEDVRAREDGAGFLGEEREQVELLRGERQRLGRPS